MELVAAWLSVGDPMYADLERFLAGQFEVRRLAFVGHTAPQECSDACAAAVLSLIE
ncbi:MAG: hypothetical protein ABW122_14725 [Ilumatobacteraceae bacterium]